MLNINKISIISNGKPDVLSCLACASVRRACVWLGSSAIPKQLLSPTIRSLLIKTFQGCPCPTLSENIQASLVIQAPYSLFPASVFSLNCPGVHTHLPALFCCHFPQSTRFGLIPVSALAFPSSDSEAPIGKLSLADQIIP